MIKQGLYFIAIILVYSAPAVAKEYGCNINTAQIGTPVTPATMHDYIKAFDFETQSAYPQMEEFKGIRVEVSNSSASSFNITISAPAAGTAKAQTFDTTQDVLTVNLDSPQAHVICWSREAVASAKQDVDGAPDLRPQGAPSTIRTRPMLKLSKETKL
jgi:hypothetical protein